MQKTQECQTHCERRKREDYSTMSQEKVNKYKEEKANRKEIMAKEKKEKMLVKVCAGVVALALFGWLGYSLYNTVTRPDTSDVLINTEAMDEYLGEVEAE